MNANFSFHVELDNTNSPQLMESNQTSIAPVDLLESFLSADSLSVSTDSLSPCSFSSLSGDEETYNSGGKRRRSAHGNSSPKRIKSSPYIIFDEVIPPHSPESGISVSSPMALYTQNPSSGKVWIEILEQPEEYYRARYASEGSRGPLKGQSQNSYPKVKLMFEGNIDHISATISVSLVNEDFTPHGVCSLATVEEDGPSNITKRATGPDFTVEFDQLRVKRERCTGGGKGRHKPKAQRHNESVGYLLFLADITTVNGQITCQRKSSAIKLTAKPECAELHAIKNDCGSAEGGEEVWIRGSKMIGNPSVYFEIKEQSSSRVQVYPGTVVREECHQNLLVVRTPRVPCNEQVVSQVVVVTGKDKLRSNTLPFKFFPTGAVPTESLPIYYHRSNPLECIPQCSKLSPCYSPQPNTPPSVDLFTNDDLSFIPLTPPTNELEGILDICVQQLDKKAEEKILPTAVLPADSSALAMQETSAPYIPEHIN